MYPFIYKYLLISKNNKKIQKKLLFLSFCANIYTFFSFHNHFLTFFQISLIFIIKIKHNNKRIRKNENGKRNSNKEKNEPSKENV